MQESAATRCCESSGPGPSGQSVSPTQILQGWPPALASALSRALPVTGAASGERSAGPGGRAAAHPPCGVGTCQHWPCGAQGSLPISQAAWGPIRANSSWKLAGFGGAAPSVGCAVKPRGRVTPLSVFSCLDHAQVQALPQTRHMARTLSGNLGSCCPSGGWWPQLPASELWKLLQTEGQAWASGPVVFTSSSLGRRGLSWRGQQVALAVSQAASALRGCSLAFWHAGWWPGC